MKKLFLTALLAASISAAFSQTTEEEFNYVTKGYKTTLEQGLDVKNGYLVETIPQAKATSNNTVKLEPKILLRKGQPAKDFAAMMIVYSLNNKVTKVYCIPHPSSNADILAKSVQDLSSAEGTQKKLLLTMMSETIGNLLAK